MTTTLCDICGKPIEDNATVHFRQASGTPPILGVKGTAATTALYEAWRCEDAHQECVLKLVAKVKNAIPAYVMQIKQETK